MDFRWFGILIIMNKKGFTALGVVIVLALLLLGGGSLYLSSQNTVDSLSTPEMTASVTSTTEIANTSLPTITILAPQEGEKLKMDSQYTIKWKGSGLNSITLTLLADGKEKQKITTLSSSLGSYTWTVPTFEGTKGPDPKYSIVIADDSRAIKATSEEFDIVCSSCAPAGY